MGRFGEDPRHFRAPGPGREFYPNRGYGLYCFRSGRHRGPLVTDLNGSGMVLCEGHLRSRPYAWRESWIYVDFPSPRESGKALVGDARPTT